MKYPTNVKDMKGVDSAPTLREDDWILIDHVHFDTLVAWAETRDDLWNNYGKLILAGPSTRIGLVGKNGHISYNW